MLSLANLVNIAKTCPPTPLGEDYAGTIFSDLRRLTSIIEQCELAIELEAFATLFRKAPDEKAAILTTLELTGEMANVASLIGADFAQYTSEEIATRLETVAARVSTEIATIDGPLAEGDDVSGATIDRAFEGLGAFLSKFVTNIAKIVKYLEETLRDVNAEKMRFDSKSFFSTKMRIFDHSTMLKVFGGATTSGKLIVASLQGADFGKIDLVKIASSFGAWGYAVNPTTGKLTAMTGAWKAEDGSLKELGYDADKLMDLTKKAIDAGKLAITQIGKLKSFSEETKLAKTKEMDAEKAKEIKRKGKIVVALAKTFYQNLAGHLSDVRTIVAKVVKVKEEPKKKGD